MLSSDIGTRQKPISCPEHVTVLGAGPAGLATAHELSANGVRVTVLERNNYVGGLATTFKHKGYKFDLGGHRWFTKNESLNDWFRQLMKGELCWSIASAESITTGDTLIIRFASRRS